MTDWLTESCLLGSWGFFGGILIFFFFFGISASSLSSRCLIKGFRITIIEFKRLILTFLRKCLTVMCHEWLTTSSPKEKSTFDISFCLILFFFWFLVCTYDHLGRCLATNGVMSTGSQIENFTIGSSECVSVGPSISLQVDVLKQHYLVEGVRDFVLKDLDTGLNFTSTNISRSDG